MTLRKKGTAVIITLMLTAGMFSGCSQANSTSSTNGGQGIMVETTVYEKVNQTILGKQVETNTLLKTLYECRIVSKDKDNITTVKVTLKESYIKEEEDKKVKNEYDSVSGLNVTDPMASPITTVYSAATGESFNATLDETGNVIEINGSKKLEQKILEKLKISDEKIKSKIQKSIKSEFGDSALKDKLQNLIIKQVADKKFSTGDNWIGKGKMDIGSDAIFNLTYKVSKNSDNTCYIDLSGKTNGEVKGDIVEVDDTEVMCSGSCEENGSIEIDKESGILSKSNILNKFNGTMEIKDGPKELKGKKIPTNVEIQIYINVKNK